jgi:D-lyxose ketol-isomerase
MKRSSINQYIVEAAAFFLENRFVLPPFGEWAPEEWHQRGIEIGELHAQRLGWDVTDFNSGDFEKIGLTLFTLRNGASRRINAVKPYAEKIMFVRDHQVTPFHYHARKTEDIINRGGKQTGRLLVKLYNRDEEDGFATSPVTVTCDGITRRLDAGGFVILGPGESITLTPFLYHTFHAIEGSCLVGEVSSTNDDDGDNYFREPVARYAEVIEDEPPTRILCTEYSKYSGVPL